MKKVTISEALPYLQQIARDCGLKLSNGNDFRQATEKLRRFLAANKGTLPKLKIKKSV